MAHSGWPTQAASCTARSSWAVSAHLLRTLCRQPCYAPTPRPHFPQMCRFAAAGEAAVDLLSRLLAFDPTRRCSPDEALAHEYFADTAMSEGGERARLLGLVGERAVDAGRAARAAPLSKVLPGALACPRQCMWTSQVVASQACPMCCCGVGTSPPCATRHVAMQAAMKTLCRRPDDAA